MDFRFGLAINRRRRYQPAPRPVGLAKSDRINHHRDFLYPHWFALGGQRPGAHWPGENREKYPSDNKTAGKTAGAWVKDRQLCCKQTLQKAQGKLQP